MTTDADRLRASINLERLSSIGHAFADAQHVFTRTMIECRGSQPAVDWATLRTELSVRFDGILSEIDSAATSDGKSGQS